MANTTGKKHGGRKKGTENKITKEARELFINTLENLTPEIEEAFRKVLKDSPSRFLDLYAKYAQYFVPKKTENDNRLTGEIVQNIINLGEGKDPNETTK